MGPGGWGGHHFEFPFCCVFLTLALPPPNPPGPHSTSRPIVRLASFRSAASAVRPLQYSPPAGPTNPPFIAKGCSGQRAELRDP